MKAFIQTITVLEKDLDELNHVNNVRYIDWVNTIAKSHWQEYATKNITDTYFWILLSHNINYKKPAFLNDELLLKTYVTKAEGVTCTRVVEIFNAKTNTLLTTSETKWCFIASKTLKPTRITEEIKNLFN